MATNFIFNMNTKDQSNFFPINQFLLCKPLADSYFIFHPNITSFLLKKKYHRSYYLNKCRMDIYQTVYFIKKWARRKRDLLLSVCTAVIIVMYAIFNINPVVSECTCVFYNVHPAYLFFTTDPSNNPHSNQQAVNIGAESQIFICERVKGSAFKI